MIKRPFFSSRRPISYAGVSVSSDPSGQDAFAQEAQQYLEVLKDATVNVQMYFPQATAESGLAVFQELAKRNASR